ncbi:MAG: transporter [Candidatus Obscuribacterales bacterium]|nr:transporter [Candidatus Obscuribacterales bacterium]
MLVVHYKGHLALEKPPASLVPLALLVALCLSFQKTYALEKSDDIDTNRPSFCQSALVVPVGSIQLENGGLYQHFQHGLTQVGVPENELRIGLLKRTEFQMFSPNMILLNQSRSTFAGTTGLQEVGLKQQIGPFKRLTASLVGGVNVPTGSKLLSGTAVMPVFRIPYSIQLSKNLAFCGMQSIIVTQPHGNIQWQPFVELTRSLGKKSAVFAEYAGFFQQNAHGPGQSILHFGGEYRLNRHNQLDLHFGFGMSKTAPAAFVGFGYSYRFDGLPWGNKKSPSSQQPVPGLPSPPAGTH